MGLCGAWGGVERRVVRWRGAPPNTLTYRRARGHRSLLHVRHLDGEMAGHRGNDEALQGCGATGGSRMLQSVRGGRLTHGGQLGSLALHVEGRRSSFSLGPLAVSQRFCRSPSSGGRACSRSPPRLLRRADGAPSPLLVHRGHHLVEQVDKCLTKQRGPAMSTSLPLSPPLTGGWKSEQVGRCGSPRAP
eukprot:scaffold1143_cov396-Pavlova_lutheri.AAC.3